MELDARPHDKTAVPKADNNIDTTIRIYGLDIHYYHSAAVGSGTSLL